MGESVDTYTYTGVVEKWTVPAGITEATFIVVGGNGRNGWGGFQKIINGGLGAKLTVKIPVIPNQVYDIYVGHNGYCVLNKKLLEYPYPDINNCSLLGKSTIPGNLGSGGTEFNYTVDVGYNQLYYNIFNGGSISAIFLNGKPIIIAGGGGAGGGAGSWVFNDYKIMEGRNSTSIIKTSKTHSNKIQFGRKGMCQLDRQWLVYISGHGGGGYDKIDNITSSSDKTFADTLITYGKGPGGTSLVPFRTLELKQDLADREGTPYISITTKP